MDRIKLTAVLGLDDEQHGLAREPPAFGSCPGRRLVQCAE
jgi:hypothetical protein